MSDQAVGQKARRPEGGDENGPAAAPQSRIDLDMLLPIASPARTTLPAARFDRHATTPVTDLVHYGRSHNRRPRMDTLSLTSVSPATSNAK